MTLDGWIAHVNSLGLLCHQITQLDDGSWQVSCRTRPVTPDLARNPEFTDLGRGTSPEEAFATMFRSKRFRAWEKRPIRGRNLL